MESNPFLVFGSPNTKAIDKSAHGSLVTGNEM